MLTLTRWKVDGVFFKPNGIGILTNSYWTFFTENAVFCISLGSISIWWETEARSKIEKYWHLPHLCYLGLYFFFINWEFETKISYEYSFFVVKMFGSSIILLWFMLIKLFVWGEMEERVKSFIFKIRSVEKEYNIASVLEKLYISLEIFSVRRSMDIMLCKKLFRGLRRVCAWFVGCVHS